MRMHFKFFSFSMALCMLALIPILGVTAQQDSNNDGISYGMEQQLFSLYKPVLHFASKEKFFQQM